MDRACAYQALVAQRKGHRFPDGLMNPSKICDGKFDSNQLGPWSRWHGALDAEVLVVGQDWGNVRYFIENRGIDNDCEKTCKNLRSLAWKAGWELGLPSKPTHERLFFTNAVLGIRQNSKSGGTIPVEWIEDSSLFLAGLLEIIKPAAVVSLGKVAYRACRLALLPDRKDPFLSVKLKLKDLAERNPIQLPGRPTLFAFYHCGPRGLPNRSMDLQTQDWEDLGAWRSAQAGVAVRR